jgi:hypothetical protein
MALVTVFGEQWADLLFEKITFFLTQLCRTFLGDQGTARALY